MERVYSFMAISILIVMAGPAIAADIKVHKECTNLLKTQVTGWKPAKPSREVRDWAVKEAFNPIYTEGDFDADGHSDIATIGTIQGKTMVALCLGRPGGKFLKLTPDGGCSDYVYTIPKGKEVWNYDAEKKELLTRDVAATACFEKSGRVFLYESDSFRIFFNVD
jgi:hypothetical protein